MRVSPRFRGGAQSGSHRPVSTPCPPNRDVRISRIRLSSGIMHLARGAPVGALLAVPAALRAPRLPEAARLHPRGASPRRAARPVHALTAPSLLQPGPFAFACDASELSAPSRGVRRQSHSRGPSSLRHPSTPEAPFLDGHYPASPVLRASPPPCRPGLPLAGSRLPRARHLQGFPCCYAFHLPCMPAPLPRRKPAGAHVALFPAGRRPSPILRRVGFRDALFGACSAFTHVPACMVAEPPKAALYQCASIHVVTSMNRSGRYQLERQLLGGFRTHQESAPFHGALRNPG